MDFKTKKIDDASVQIVVTTTAREVEEAYNEAYRRAGAKIKLPGFRPGKAPAELIEKHLGEAVADDAARSLIADSFQKIVEGLKPSPISLPRFEVETFDRSKGATFKGVYDIWPEVKLGKYKKVKLTEDKAIVSDADVVEELDRLQKAHAVLKPREGEAAHEGDYVTVGVKIVEGDDTIFETKEYSFWTNKDDPFPGLAKAVVGMVPSDVKTYTEIIEADFKDPKYAGKTVTVTVNLETTAFPEYPELNDDFAKDLGADFETLAALKEDIKKKLAEKAKAIFRHKSEDELVEKIVADSKVTVPASMIQSEYEHRLEHIKSRFGKDVDLKEVAHMSGKSFDALDKEMRDASMRTARDRLILLEITRKEKLDVSDSDLDDEIRKRYASLVKGDQVESLLKNAELREDTRSRLLYRKTMEWLYQHAEIKEGKNVPVKEVREDDHVH